MPQSPSPPPSPGMNPMRLWLAYAPLGAIALGTGLLWFFGVPKLLTLEALLASKDVLKAYVAGHFLASLGLFIVVYAAAVALSLPGAALLTVVAGFLFGWVAGAPAAVAGATLGAVALFLIAKTTFGGFLRARAGAWLARFADGFRQNAASYLLFLRLAPIFPFWLVNLAPAFLGIGLWPFFWTTLLGILPGTYVFAFAGASLDVIASEQHRLYQACIASAAQNCHQRLALSALVTPQTLLALGGLAALCLLPVLVKRWRLGKNKDNGPDT